MEIAAFAYGVDVPMSTAIYQALVYVTGPLAPYLCGFMLIGFITVMYLVYTYVIPKVIKIFKTLWNKFKSSNKDANLVYN